MTSKLSAVGLLTLLFVTWVAAVLYITYSKRQTPIACGQICRQDIASATYFGLIELDCDGQWDSPVSYGGSTQCSDELGNVNRLPRFDKVVQLRNKNMVVTETFFLTGAANAVFPVEVRFRQNGEMAGIK